MQRIVIRFVLAAILLTTFQILDGRAGSAQSQIAVGGSTAESRIVRLATVRTVVDAGLLQELLDDFQKQSGYSVQVYVGKDVYEQAKAGKADIVFSHFRHAGLSSFVLDGFGLWPESVLTNVTAFLAPADDPAGVRNVSDPVEIFRRIAFAKSPFVVNGDANTRYLIDTLWNGAGRPDKTGWYIDLARRMEMRRNRRQTDARIRSGESRLL